MPDHSNTAEGNYWKMFQGTSGVYDDGTANIGDVPGWYKVEASFTFQLPVSMPVDMAFRTRPEAALATITYHRPQALIMVANVDNTWTVPPFFVYFGEDTRVDPVIRNTISDPGFQTIVKNHSFSLTFVGP